MEPATNSLNNSLDGLLVEQTLVNLHTEEVPVHLLNLTEKKIKQGTDVAICNTAESVLCENRYSL